MRLFHFIVKSMAMKWDDNLDSGWDEVLESNEVPLTQDADSPSGTNGKKSELRDSEGLQEG